MSEIPSYQAALIKYRLERANQTLQDAKLLLVQGGTPASIINRSYYAMFYAVLALLVTVDRETSQHSGVISAFDEMFIKRNVFPKEMSKMFHRAFDLRQTGDYEDVTDIDLEQAEQVLKSAEEFIKTIEEN